VLYDPKDSKYPTDCFYDTAYHLTYDMAQEHTDMIITKFKQLVVSQPSGAHF
jgi:hypothetical protein